MKGIIIATVSSARYGARKNFLEKMFVSAYPLCDVLGTLDWGRIKNAFGSLEKFFAKHAFLV